VLAITDMLLASERADEAHRHLDLLIRAIDEERTILRNEADVELLAIRLARTGHQSEPEVQAVAHRLSDQVTQQVQRSRFRQLMTSLLDARGRTTDMMGGSQEPIFLQDPLEPTIASIVYQAFRLPSGDEVLVGARIEHGRLGSKMIAPMISAEADDKIVLWTEPADAAGPESRWVVPMTPTLPWMQLGPSPVFVTRVESAARTQRSMFIGVTLLMATALIVAVGMALRAARREWEAVRLRSDFVANVSHELKTPPALSRLFGDTLRHGRVTERSKQQQYYEIITRESERLTHLVDNILDFSRIQSGRKDYEKTPCDLGLVAKETFESYEFQLEDHPIAHELHIEPDLPTVDADSEAIRQGLLNLIHNVIKYSPDEKHVFVRVYASRQKRAVAMEVRDRGIGIPAADRDQLFEPFYRVADDRV